MKLVSKTKTIEFQLIRDIDKDYYRYRFEDSQSWSEGRSYSDMMDLIHIEKKYLKMQGIDITLKNVGCVINF